MKSRTLLSCTLVALLLDACSASGAGGLTAAQAAKHVGERATVCGTVASSHYADASEGQPTFINLDKPWPDQVFTIVIFGDYRARFPSPPDTWRGRVCVTGKITSYHGKPEMKVFDPAQVRR